MSEGQCYNNIVLWAYTDNIFDAALGKTKSGRTYLYEVTKVATL